MKRRTFVKLAAGSALMAGTGLGHIVAAQAAGKDIVYLTPGLDLPFWRYLSKGVENAAKDELGPARLFTRLPQDFLHARFGARVILKLVTSHRLM